MRIKEKGEKKESFWPQIEPAITTLWDEYNNH